MYPLVICILLLGSIDCHTVRTYDSLEVCNETGRLRATTLARKLIKRGEPAQVFHDCGSPVILGSPR